MMKLYITYGNLLAVSETDLLSFLSHSRRTHIARRPWADRMASAAAACLLRYALHDTKNASLLDAPIVWEGKPHFADPAIPLGFNLSHTVDKTRGEFAAAVLLSDEDAVGVDLELVHEIRCRDALMRRLFTAEERAYVAAMGDGAFFDIWCAKEAFVKWTGEGFSRPLSHITVDVSAKTAVSGAAACDLEWYTVGDCHICCAAENLSSGMEIQILTPEQLLSM